MVLRGFGQDETPSSVNRKLVALGANGFIGPLVVWGGLSSAFPSLQHRGLVLCRDLDAPLAEIDSALAAGQPVVVEIDRFNGAGLQTHWVLLYAKRGEDYLMLDPWPMPPDGQPVTLIERYGFGRSLGEIITAVAWYTWNGMADILPSACVVETDLYVRVVDGIPAGLRLRAQPNTYCDTLAVMPSGTALRILEPEENARPKIGEVNQWVLVREPQGQQGYVAAWFVRSEEAEANASPLPAAAAPIPDPLAANTQASLTVPDPVPGLTLYVSPAVGTRGLRMRAEPGLGGALVLVLKAGARLTVLEDPAVARIKIGRMYQWIEVREDRGGQTGFVAAWLLQEGPPTQTLTGDIATPAAEQARPAELIVMVPFQLGNSAVRLREKPSLRAPVLALEPAGTRLTVIEETAPARKKIGRPGRWLRVRDLQYREGYVAAWFIRET